MFPADVFATLTHSFHVRPNYIGCILIVASIVLVDVIVISSVVFLLFNVCPVQSPCWVIATSECFVEVIFFLFEQLVVGTDCLSSVFKSVDKTELSRQMVVTVPLQIQICVCAFYTLMSGGNCQAVASLLYPGREWTHLV